MDTLSASITRCAITDWGIEPGAVEVVSFTAIDPAQSPAAPKDPVPADVATRWLRGEPCRLPCYEGLTPGVTIVQAAFRHLRRHSLVGGVTLTRFPAQEYGEVVWTWADGSSGGRARFRLGDSEIITSIEPSGDPHITLGEVIAAYGEPTDVITTDFCASWGKDRFYHLEFLNRSVGLYLRGPYKDVNHVHAGLPIQGIIIYKPGSNWTHFDYSYTHTEGISVAPWQSYQDFFFYSGTDPAKICL
jgi:hypothetical protein